MEVEFAEFERELIVAFLNGGVAFAIVGGAAVRLHGYNRQRHDLDILVNPTRENAQRVLDALPARHSLRGLSVDGLMRENARIQFDRAYGLDIFTSVIGVDTSEVIDTAEWIAVGETYVPTISRDLLIQAKLASGSEIDMDDVAHLQE
jgi:hypothetical protein